MKGRVKKVKSLQHAWKLFKSTIMEAQIECTLQIRKGATKSKRKSAYLMNKPKKPEKARMLSFRVKLLT